MTIDATTAPPPQPIPPRAAATAPAATMAGRTPAVDAARRFEAVFAGEMARIMMDTVDTSGPFGGGHGEEVFRGVLAEHLGGAIAERGGIGLAPAVLQQIIRLQEGSRPDGK